MTRSSQLCQHWSIELTLQLFIRNLLFFSILWYRSSTCSIPCQLCARLKTRANIVLRIKFMSVCTRVEADNLVFRCLRVPAPNCPLYMVNHDLYSLIYSHVLYSVEISADRLNAQMGYGCFTVMRFMLIVYMLWRGIYNSVCSICKSHAGLIFLIALAINCR